MNIYLFDFGFTCQGVWPVNSKIKDITDMKYLMVRSIV